jgi:tetratricopeptide (TPR) repeat protein
MNSLRPDSIEDAWQVYCLGSAAFSYSGASFGISRRFLARAADVCRRKRIEEIVGFGFTRFTVNYLSGAWNEEPGMSDEVIDAALRQGVFWDVNSYLGLECDRQLRIGRFDAAERCLQRLAELGGSYGYEFAVANHDGTKALLHLERRELDDALKINDHYLEDRYEDALRVRHVSLRAYVHLLRGDNEAARADLDAVKALLEKADMIPPWHRSMYTVARLRYCAEQMRDPAQRKMSRSSFKRSLRDASHVARRVASVRPETYRLAAYVYWSLGDSRRADRWWAKAIAESERLGTQPELARALLDRARCWATSSSAHRRERSATHLEQCREIFERIGTPDVARLPQTAVS